jgi:hypothetical protein
MQTQKNKLIKKRIFFFFFEIWQVFPSKKRENMQQNIPSLFFHVFFLHFVGKKKKSWVDRIKHFLLINRKGPLPSPLRRGY